MNPAPKTSHLRNAPLTNGSSNHSHTPNGKTTNSKVSSALQQLIELQRLTLDVGKKVAGDALRSRQSASQRAKSATALSNLNKSWDTLEQRKRILRGLGNPKSVEARNAKPRRKVKAETIATDDAPAKESL